VLWRGFYLIDMVVIASYALLPDAVPPRGLLFAGEVQRCLGAFWPVFGVF